MQTDMHYYGTYAMACSAGIKPHISQAIATAAEYVDDSDYINTELLDGAYVEAAPTAHHPVNRHNIDFIDQRKVWIPFHFLPGNEGTTLHEKLVCTMDSQIARELVAHHLALADEEYGLDLIGITAHVYADTFSHYGFSGITSKLNRVDDETIQLKAEKENVLDYIKKKADAFKQTFVAGKVANAVGLGHGAVATFPDRPYLTWSFLYEETGRPSGERNNQATFLEACRKLHRMFTDFGQRRPDYVDKNIQRDFVQIENAIARILAVEGSMEERIQEWQQAAINGELFKNVNKEPIPTYEDGNFHSETDLLSTLHSGAISYSALYKFLKAAQVHRDYVLDELLPRHGIEVLHRL